MLRHREKIDIRQRLFRFEGLPDRGKGLGGGEIAGMGRALAFGAYALVELDQIDRAREWAKRALEADKDEPAIIYNVACMFAQLEEVDEAITLLERSISQGYGHRAWLEHDSDLAPLRGHPRFQALLDRMG